MDKIQKQLIDTYLRKRIIASENTGLNEINIHELIYCKKIGLKVNLSKLNVYRLLKNSDDINITLQLLGHENLNKLSEQNIIYFLHDNNDKGFELLKYYGDYLSEDALLRIAFMSYGYYKFILDNFVNKFIGDNFRLFIVKSSSSDDNLKEIIEKRNILSLDNIRTILMNTNGNMKEIGKYILKFHHNLKAEHLQKIIINLKTIDLTDDQ